MEITSMGGGGPVAETGLHQIVSDRRDSCKTKALVTDKLVSFHISTPTHLHHPRGQFGFRQILGLFWFYLGFNTRKLWILPLIMPCAHTWMHTTCPATTCLKQFLPHLCHLCSFAPMSVVTQWRGRGAVFRDSWGVLLKELGRCKVFIELMYLNIVQVMRSSWFPPVLLVEHICKIIARRLQVRRRFPYLIFRGTCC